MKTSLLAALLSRQIEADVFLSAIRGEIQAHYKNAGTKGSSLPVYEEPDTGLVIGWDAIVNLCRLYADGQVSYRELSYIADFIQLSDSIDYEEDGIADVVFSMTDPEINGIFSVEDAERTICERTSRDESQ